MSPDRILPDESGFVKKALVTVDGYIFKISALSDESDLNIYEACIGFGIHLRKILDEGKMSQQIEVRLGMPDGYRSVFFKLVGRIIKEDKEDAEP